MKKRIIVVGVCAAICLSLTGCGSENPLDSNVLNVLTSNTSSTSSVNTSTANISSSGDIMPEIPVTDESAFKYEYKSEYDGMMITDYLKESPKIRIPDTLEGEPVKIIDLSNCEKEITQLVMPDSVLAFYLSDKTATSLRYINLPSDGTDYNIITKYQHNGFTSLEEFYEASIETAYRIFRDYINLEAIAVSKNTPRLATYDGMLYYEHDSVKVLLVCPQGKSGSVTIPNNVTGIHEHAFDGCENLNVIYKNKTYKNTESDVENDIDALVGTINYGEDYAIIKSKVTSADSTAKNLVQTINVWLTENITAGGLEASECKITVCSNKGSVTIDSNIKFPEKADHYPVTLAEMIEADYINATFAATIYISNQGKAWACAYRADTTTAPTAPGLSDFEAGSYTWKQVGCPGVLPTGEIVGTSPKLPLKPGR